LEIDIESLEKEKNILETALNSGENDYEKLSEITTRFGEITQMIDEKTLRWMELAEFSK